MSEAVDQSEIGRLIDDLRKTAWDKCVEDLGDRIWSTTDGYATCVVAGGATTKTPSISELLDMMRSLEEKFPPSKRATLIQCGRDYYDALKEHMHKSPQGVPSPIGDFHGVRLCVNVSLPPSMAVIEFADGSEEWCDLRGGSIRMPRRKEVS
jgi:hypothetical protein